MLATDGAGFGGAEIAMCTAARALAAVPDLRVHMVVPPVTERFEAVLEQLRGDGVAIVTASGPIASSPIAGAAWLRRAAADRVRELLVSAQPDAVVINLYALWSGAAIVDAARADPRVQVVAGFLQLAHPPSRVGARFGLLRDRLLPRHLARFDRLLTVAHCQAAALRAMGVATDCAFVGQPVAAAVRTDWPTRADSRAQLGLGDKKLVGLVGRVVFSHKGQDDALGVARLLDQSGMDVDWVVVGDGPDLPRLRSGCADLGLADRFHFVGWRENVVDLLPAFDAVLLPSKFEGLPLTAVEAICAGVPVVGYSVDGIADLLDPPFAVTPGDVTQLASALESALRQPATWHAARYRERAAICSPDLVAGRIVAVLERACAMSRRGGTNAPEHTGSRSPACSPKSESAPRSPTQLGEEASL